MERPRKRPRLSMFADEAPNAELDTARHQNDRFLKGRFEAIFRKYERDFSGIGDEVDLSTGEIVVDNGHLAGLDEDIDTRSEADESIGEVSPKSARHTTTASPGKQRPITNGRAMLRAMTVAPDRENAYFEDGGAEEVIESIETIAQTAAEKDVGEENDVSVSDDDESDIHETTASGRVDQVEDREAQNNFSGSDEREMDANKQNWPEEPQRVAGIPMKWTPTPPRNDPATLESDIDSLFEGQIERDSTPDSLFEMPKATSSTTPHEGPNSDADFFDAVGELDHDAILARFGDAVGHEILNLIQKRDKAELHIEKAWRIPVQVEQPVESAIAQENNEGTGLGLRSNSPSASKSGTSLWSLGLQGSRKLESHQERTMRVIRAESEDPLQEGFGDGGNVEVRLVDASIDHSARLLRRGTCPFCKEHYYSAESAKKHLSDVLANTDKVGSESNTHNVDRVTELLANLEEVAEDIEHVRVESPIIYDEERALMIDAVDADDSANSVDSAPQAALNDGEESEDDLFVDVGYIHSDDDEDHCHADTPSTPHRPSLEIPDSDEESETRLSLSPKRHAETAPKDGPLEQVFDIESPSPHRRRKSLYYHESRSARRPPSISHDSGYELGQRPEFRTTADLYDRRAGQNYQGSRATEKSQLSLRPRTAHQRLCMALPGRQKTQQCQVSGKEATQKGVRQLRTARSSSSTLRRDQAQLDAQPATSNSPGNALDTTQIQYTLEEQSLLFDSDENESYQEYHTPREANDSPNESAQMNEPREEVDLAANFSPVMHSAASEEPLDADADENVARYDACDTEPVYHFNVEDFKSLVVMHEHEGQGLESVGELMSNHYYNYRLEVDPSLGVVQASEWNREDELLLLQLSLNPQTLMETIKRRLPHRSQFEIGKKLAERWRTEMDPAAQRLRPSRPTPGLPGVKVNKTHVQIVKLNEADAVLEDYEGLVPSRRKRKPDPIKQRVCRQLSPSGTWRGCGRIFSQRSAVHRHWKDSNRVCLKPGFDRMASPAPQKRNKATKENGVQCRHTSPGGTVRGCGEWFRQKSTMYRHWRNSGRECRPPWHKQSTIDTSDGEQVHGCERGEEEAYDVGRASAAAAALSGRSASRDP